MAVSDSTLDHYYREYVDAFGEDAARKLCATFGNADPKACPRDKRAGVFLALKRGAEEVPSTKEQRSKYGSPAPGSLTKARSFDELSKPAFAKFNEQKAAPAKVIKVDGGGDV